MLLILTQLIHPPRRRRRRRDVTAPSFILALLALVLVLLVPGASAARALRQHTDTHVSVKGYNVLDNPYAVHAQAHEAEARSHASSTGIAHNEASFVTIAGDAYPAARGATATHASEQSAGRGASTGGAFPAVSIAAFGPVAEAGTSTGARAFSGADALPLLPQDHADPEAAHGATSSVFEPANLRSRPAESVGVTGLPPRSVGVSNAGGGPTSVAEAGEAVAVSIADTPRNTMGIS